MEKKINQANWFLFAAKLGMQLRNGAQERAPFSNLSLLKLIYSKKATKYMNFMIIFATIIQGWKLFYPYEKWNKTIVSSLE